MSAASDVPEPVRQIVSRIVDTALARCDCAGITHEDFYAALTAEMRLHPRGLLERVIERTFERLAAQRS
jgi:hypothetical protein